MIVLDRLYMKLEGAGGVISLPLCETGMLPGTTYYDFEASQCGTDVFCVKNTGASMSWPTFELKKFLARELFNNKKKIEDFVIQPGGREQIEAVSEFISKYS